MRNSNNKASQVHVPGKATLSHETATNPSTLTISLKGTKDEILNELNTIMHVQVSYILNAIETGTASLPDPYLSQAMNLYWEAHTKLHYFSNGINE